MADADGSQHLYVVTEEWGESASGARPRVYTWHGRRGGPQASSDRPQRL